MVRLAISEAAFDAIASTMRGGFKSKRAPNGDWFIWIPHDVLAKLRAMRQPSENYSDVILALAGR
jgi:hypothetical protein